MTMTFETVANVIAIIVVLILTAINVYGRRHLG